MCFISLIGDGTVGGIFQFKAKHQTVLVFLFRCGKKTQRTMWNVLQSTRVSSGACLYWYIINRGNHGVIVYDRYHNISAPKITLSMGNVTTAQRKSIRRFQNPDQHNPEGASAQTPNTHLRGKGGRGGKEERMGRLTATGMSEHSSRGVFSPIIKTAVKLMR